MNKHRIPLSLLSPKKLRIMKNLVLVAASILLVAPVYAQKVSKEKKEIISLIDARKSELTSISDQIWAFEEIAFRETQSAAILADYAEKQGFKVTRGVADIPTAFTAEYGSGRPIIGILGEFDALPGLSQQAVPKKSPRNEGAPGHGCGHNLFGTASLAAATAIKDLISQGKLKGTVRFYGTPAEEKFFGKLWMIREGLFDDLDFCMDWHPGDETKSAVQSSLALVDFMVEFYGQAAHGASDPWNGRSAGDALELYTAGINYYREHVKPTVRMHYHIMDAGKVVNVVPDYAKIWVRVRDTNREGVMPVYERVKAMAEGAAILADVEYEANLISGIHEIVVNRTGGSALQKNLEYLGDIEYTAEEIAFAKRIQENTGKDQVGLDASISPMEVTKENPGGGSTDAGDVSQVVPMVRLVATTAPKDTPWHSWAVTACGGMSIGHKGMIYAAKALAMTMVDLYTNEELRDGVTAEWKERVGDYQYVGIIPPGPAPINADQ